MSPLLLWPFFGEGFEVTTTTTTTKRRRFSASGRVNREGAGAKSRLERRVRELVEVPVGCNGVLKIPKLLRELILVPFQCLKAIKHLRCLRS